MSMTTYTDAGKAIILTPRLTTLSDDRWGTNGSVGLAILLGQNDEPQCYSLVWQWGGDWTSFGDGDESDIEKLNGWEPDAIREAVEAAVKMLPDNEQLADDLEWFTDWADAAEKTLAGDDA